MGQPVQGEKPHRNRPPRRLLRTAADRQTRAPQEKICRLVNVTPCLVITLTGSKGATRKQTYEQVLIHDPGVVALAASVMKSLGEDDYLYNDTYNKLKA